MSPATQKTAAWETVAKAKVMTRQSRNGHWRSRGVDPGTVKGHKDGIRGPITLKAFHWGRWPTELTTKREDMYGHDGR